MKEKSKSWQSPANVPLACDRGLRGGSNPGEVWDFAGVKPGKPPKQILGGGVGSRRIERERVGALQAWKAQFDLEAKGPPPRFEPVLHSHAENFPNRWLLEETYALMREVRDLLIEMKGR